MIAVSRTYDEFWQRSHTRSENLVTGFSFRLVKVTATTHAYEHGINAARSHCVRLTMES